MLTLLAVSVVVFAVMNVLPGDPALTILGMDASEDALAALREQFARSGVDVDARLAKHRSADTGRAERKALYATGGVVLCGARAAYVDLLDETLDATRIEGILVLDAERCSESSPEAFALRLFRDRSTRGWVSAISEAPERLGGGFACLAKVVKTLTVASCALWPRFENRLADALAPESEA